ncbi:MAG: hypothetical protein FIO02_02390 [Nitrosopumilales archaeon]|nr:hypothetical protein [Nitrosopumilales archaeon]
MEVLEAITGLEYVNNEILYLSDSTFMKPKKLLMLIVCQPSSPRIAPSKIPLCYSKAKSNYAN